MMDNYTDTILERLKAINALLPDLTVKGAARSVTVYKYLPTRNASWDDMPFAYAEDGPMSVRRGDAHGLMTITHTFTVKVIVQSFTTEQHADDGSEAMKDAVNAKHELLALYAPRLYLDNAGGSQLGFLMEPVEIRTISTNAFSREPGNPQSPLYAGAQVVLDLRYQVNRG